MVINQLHFPGGTIAPRKADSPLIIYPNTVLSSPPAPKGFKPVAWWGSQILKAVGRVNDQQFCPSTPLNLHGQAPHGLPGENGCNALVAKTPDHAQT